jgi:hypothetical protein
MRQVYFEGLRVAPAAAERALEEFRFLGNDVAVEVKLLLVITFSDDSLYQRRADEPMTESAGSFKNE